MKINTYFVSMLVLVLVSGSPEIMAQNKDRQSVVVEYFDDPLQVSLKDADGFELANIHIGMQLLAGESIETKNSSVEIRLDPNNTIMKIGPNTRFKIDQLAGNNNKTHGFTLIEGKIRAVVAKSSGTQYRFNTPAAVAGVRGTDFGLDVEAGKRDRILVKNGIVDFEKNKTELKVAVGSGQAADAYAPVLEPLDLSTQELADFFSSMEFEALNPDQVPGEAPATPAPVKPATTSINESVQSPQPVLDKKQPIADLPTRNDSVESPATPATTPEPSTTGSATPKDSGTDKETKILEDIKKILGLEIGSVTIDDVMYGKLVLMPKIDVEDFKMGFYIPLIYSNDLFDPSGWYKPNGNDEWSFGTDQGTDTLSIVSDVLQDIILKIKYMEIFNKNDPFFLALGSMPSMTLGHGILMGNYSNDTDFPSTRRTGFHLGLDLGGFAFEALTNDIANPEIIGTRILMRPLHPAFKLGTGLSFAADFNPLGALPATVTDSAMQTRLDTARAVNPYILNIAADIDVPVFEGDIFSLLAYADFAGMMPYLNAPVSRSGMQAIPAGLYWSHLFSLDTKNLLELHNYGIQTGIMGKLLIMDYRIEFQSFNGTFQSQYFDQTYDHTRGLKALDLVTILQNTDSTVYDMQKLGIFGKLGFNILDIVELDISYKWPWTTGSGALWTLVDQSNPDDFTFSVGLNEELIPYGIDANIEFKRSHFKELLLATAGYSLFDSWATFTGSVDIPVGMLFKIRATVGTALVRDSSGKIDYSSGAPVIQPTFTLETVF